MQQVPLVHDNNLVEKKRNIFHNLVSVLPYD